MAGRYWLAWTLRAVAILALLTGLMPSLHYEGGNVGTTAERDFLKENTHALPGRTDATIGWQTSPLIHYHRETILRDEAGAISTTQTTGTSVNLISWSCASLVLGCLLLVAVRRTTQSAGSSP